MSISTEIKSEEIIIKVGDKSIKLQPLTFKAHKIADSENLLQRIMNLNGMDSIEAFVQLVLLSNREKNISIEQLEEILDFQSIEPIFKAILKLNGMIKDEETQEVKSEEGKV